MPGDSSDLVRHPFLEGMDEELVRLMAASSMPVTFAENERIFEEGDPANRFYLIHEGRVMLESAEDNPVCIQVIGPGEVLGWSWLFPPYYWHFSARAIEPVKATFFYGTRLREQCESNPVLGYELMKRVSRVVVDRLQTARLSGVTNPKAML